MRTEENSGETEPSPLALAGEKDICFAGFNFLPEDDIAMVRTVGDDREQIKGI